MVHSKISVYSTLYNGESTLQSVEIWRATFWKYGIDMYYVNCVFLIMALNTLIAAVIQQSRQWNGVCSRYCPNERIISYTSDNVHMLAAIVTLE